MDKKYQVFVSSTYLDLKEERREVIQALLELDCIPVGMEFFPATDDTQWSLIQRLIDDSDYYILIVGGRYGSLSSEGISFTQKEYEYAINKGIPTIGFLPENPDNIEIGKTDKDPEHERKLEDFKTLVKKKLCKTWSSPKELGSVVSRSLIRLIKDRPRVGWVKADIAVDPSIIQELYELREKNTALEQKISDTVEHFDTSLLQQGEDLFNIRYSYEKMGIPYLCNSELSLSWDELFKIVAPVLLEETTEQIINERIKRTISFLPEHVIDLGEDEVSEIDKVHVYIDDITQIKVQLVALGLIERSGGKSTSKDQILWKLTPKGERKMIGLMALKKKNVNQPGKKRPNKKK